jgi:hypothetical protein
MRSRFPRTMFWLQVILVASLAFGAGPWAAAQQSDGFGEEGPILLGNPGYVVISAGLDSTRGFEWHRGPGPGQRSLTWGQGVLTLADSQEVEAWLDVDLAVPCSGQLSGLGHTGRLVFQDGIFEISEPVLLSDGALQLYVTAGELEVRGQRIRYTGPAESTDRDTDPRAGYIFLAGMVLLVVVLMRRTALRKRNKS